MSSPRLGVVRDSMLSDPLLIKVPLGKARTRGLAVPGPDFTFGTSSRHLRDGGVAEVLSGWNVQSRPEESTQRPDFVSLNRDAVKSGLVTSKELSQYRVWAAAQNQAPRKPEGRASRQPNPVPDITFGVANRTPSPLADLLSHHYARQWLEDQLSRNQASTHKPRMKPDSVRETRTSLLRRSRSLPVAQTPFELSSFSQDQHTTSSKLRLQVAPALDTFRDAEARQQALRAQPVDPRRGRRGPD
ncbi:cilia- and flagella-associated protein 77 isoform 1-T2 [Odontesthes bonariensis]|uniref:cilia- and flagella-associated protein 77 isoform X1 n=1 Tax=Odontesthes bonariensis TaxID=219752 RepID=UPI003F585830